MKKEFEKGYRSVYYQPGDAPVFSFRTGLTVYEETFSDGMLCPVGWNAAGYPLNVLTNCPTRIPSGFFTEPQAFRLDANGETADSFLSFVDFSSEEQEGKTLAALRLFSEEEKLSITVYTELDGTACFSRWIEIKNDGDRSASVNRLAPMSGPVEVIYNYKDLTDAADPEEFYTLGYMQNSCGNKEGNLEFRPLRQDKTVIDGRFLRERWRHPMFLLTNRLLGTTMIAQFAWSAGYEFSFDYNTAPEDLRTRLAFSADLAAYSPMLRLAPGESFVSPKIHIGIVAGDADDAINAMNDHLRTSVFEKTQKQSSRMLVGAGMGPEHDMSVETTKRFMDQMASIGCDVFIVDAGWYNAPHEEMSHWWSRVGDWHPNKDRYPNGLAEISDYCHKKGMKFGMWMEPERIGAEEIVNVHPDWFPKRRNGTAFDTFVDMTNPVAAKWVEEETARVIAEYKLDLLRIDYNIGSDCMLGYQDRNGGRECNALRHVEAVYTMYRNLKKRFPDVIFENCAGGGGRTDLGQLEFFNHTWVSDNQIPPRSFFITNGMTAALPPERVDRLVAGMGCHTRGSLDFHMRNAMFGHLTMNVFSPASAEWNDQQLEFIRHSITLYKEVARPLIPTCRVYHHTPSVSDIRKTGFGILENASQEGDVSMIGVFSFPEAQRESVTVFPRGIDRAGKYEVYFDNTRARAEVSGFELCNTGINIRIPTALSSELIVLKRIRD